MQQGAQHSACSMDGHYVPILAREIFCRDCKRKATRQQGAQNGAVVGNRSGDWICKSEEHVWLVFTQSIFTKQVKSTPRQTRPCCPLAGFLSCLWPGHLISLSYFTGQLPHPISPPPHFPPTNKMSRAIDQGCQHLAGTFWCKHQLMNRTQVSQDN